MPKLNHGPEPKAAMPSLLVMLRSLRTRVDFNTPQDEKYFESCFDRAVELEARLDELHDAVEEAIGLLNEVAGWDLESEGGAGSGCEEGSFAEGKMQEALAALNRVL